ncbi:hypothetical protein BY996DRAFT_6562377 [Phakopsora pachyrhizi]|nr:hypothetical protein BY996DRAFT_6562377 [Phakopsora pachyrhizi]
MRGTTRRVVVESIGGMIEEMFRFWIDRKYDDNNREDFQVCKENTMDNIKRDEIIARRQEKQLSTKDEDKQPVDEYLESVFDELLRIKNNAASNKQNKTLTSIKALQTYKDIRKTEQLAALRVVDRVCEYNGWSGASAMSKL